VIDVTSTREVAMGEKTDRIERYIQQQRRDCQDNVIELKQKVRRSVDWRSHVEERPLTMVGIAFGGGVLLSTLLDAGGRSRSQERSPDDRPSRWGILRAALLAVAASELKGFVDDLLPGFEEEYRKAEASQRSF
jgi:hypothetical protein